MTPRERTAEHWSYIAKNIAIMLACIVFCIAALWMVMSKQDSKLYEADNVVCVSQPFAVQCFERKPR
jgi:lipopolysaccharide/colanic/teichoic acid biosynthesis glycosyltransferase